MLCTCLSSHASNASRYNLKSFVDISSAFRWCPGRGCDFVAMGSTASSSSSLRAVLCKCGVLFCFKCGEEAHVPASCDDMVTWVEKCRNESETANWILANTRKCVGRDVTWGGIRSSPHGG